MLACLLVLLAPGLAGTLDIRVPDTVQAHARCELSIEGVPAAANPFDPDQVRVDALVTTPSGRSLRIPAFWSRTYQRSLSGGMEVLAPTGVPGWRVRHWPTEPGPHRWVVEVATNGVVAGVSEGRTVVVAAAPEARPAPGPARVGASMQFLAAPDGSPLPLVGANLCWHGSRGTFDYDDWLPALARNGANHVRVWMCPWAFGIENGPGTLTRYRLDRAYQLDHVMALAEKLGVHVQLCIDYHGMFQTRPDPTFGGLDDWKINPYSAVLGGPASNPNAFFTSATAMRTYQKRLRYLVARYGYSPFLFAWEFFNEIDNAVDNGGVNMADVARWHATQAAWLRANDPLQHLVTTSLSGTDQPALWGLPGIDLVNHHSYGAPNPAPSVASTVARLRKAYGKPVIVGEFGIDARGWMRAQDPFLRGFRQNLWGAMLGGAAGTGMSWWWENLASENVLPLLAPARSIPARVAWGSGAWTPIAFLDPGPPPPMVAEPVPGAPSFGARLVPSASWGAKPRGTMAVPTAASAQAAPQFLNAFVHGSTHPDLRVPFRIHAAFGSNATATARVNSVSVGARLSFYVDGSLVLSTNLPDRDGKFDAFVNEYGIPVSIPVPPGLHAVEVRNTGADWFTLDALEIAPVIPSRHANGWQPAPTAVGVASGSAALLYACTPGVAWPVGATDARPEALADRSLTLLQWPPGTHVARWFHPVTGTDVAVTSATTRPDGSLPIPLPAWSDDLVGILVPQPRLRDARIDRGPRLQFQLESPGVPAGAQWILESSTNLRDWTPWSTHLHHPAAAVSAEVSGDARFFRARP